jgi:hypothetical protein
LTEEEDERRMKLQDSENARWRASQDEENKRWREEKARENAIVLKNEEGLRMSMIVNLEYDEEPVQQPQVATRNRGGRRNQIGNGGSETRITTTRTTTNQNSQRNGYSSQQTPVQQNRNPNDSTDRRVTTKTVTKEHRSPITVFNSLIVEKHVASDGRIEYVEVEEASEEHHHVPHHHHEDGPVQGEQEHKPHLEGTDRYFTRSTGKQVESVVNCWRNPKDAAARGGYADRHYQTHNMHKMKPTADLMNSRCQHESWVVDKEGPLSPKSRYNAEFCISQPGVMDQNRTKSSVIYGEPRSEFESRQVQSPTKVRNPALYHSTINEIEKIDRLTKSKIHAAGMSKERVPGLGKSYL